jgi:nitrous oxidase accessory protein NosD
MTLPMTNDCCLTVGPAHADIIGRDGRAIQIALDALAYRGGGTVRLLAGEYTLTNAIYLRANVRLIGEDRDKCILRRRGPVVWSDLAEDADVGQAQIRPTHPDRFEPGMGVATWDAKLGWADGTLTRSVTAIEDGLLRVNRYITADRRAEHGGRVINHYPLILGFETPNVHVEGLTLDARVNDPDGVIGRMTSAALYLFRSPDSVIRGVTVTGNPGDGICFGKTSERTVVEDCETAWNGFHGIHPGSHSAYSHVRNCHIHHNGSDGLYICWGIHHGSFTGNYIHHNGLVEMRSGISIGHKDTDNLIADNHIHDNKKFGICFRTKTEANGAHRNTLRNNLIENNGCRPEEFTDLKARLEPWEGIGCGIHVSPITHDLTLEDNTIRETRRGDERTQHHGIWLMNGVSRVMLKDNTITGHIESAVRDDAGAVIEAVGV